MIVLDSFSCYKRKNEQAAGVPSNIQLNVWRNTHDGFCDVLYRQKVYDGVRRFVPDPLPLFSYGSLKTPVVQHEVFGRILSGVSDVLPGFELTHVNIEGERYVAITPSDNPHAVVAGIVSNLIEEELYKADAYKTTAYRRALRFLIH